MDSLSPSRSANNARVPRPFLRSLENISKNGISPDTETEAEAYAYNRQDWESSMAAPNIYIDKADYCTLMSQQSRDDEARDNWLWLATQWLSLATNGSIFPFDKLEPRDSPPSEAQRA